MKSYLVLLVLTLAVFVGSLIDCVNEEPNEAAVLLLASSSLGLLGHIFFLSSWATYRLKRDPALRLRVLVGGGAVAILGAGVFRLLQEGHEHHLETAAICDQIRRAPTLEGRDATLHLTQQREASLLGRMMMLLEGNSSCADMVKPELIKDRARLERGECPMIPLQDTPCRCGEDMWPTPRPCLKPACAYWMSEGPALTCD